jgi:Tfp pilus assembly protein PilN
MSLSAHRWLSIALLALALVAGAGFALQRQSAAALQEEIALLRDEQRQLARLRADNERLRAAETPAVEVERLRADRAALVRLRTEIEEMKTRAEKRPR